MPRLNAIILAREDCDSLMSFCGSNAVYWVPNLLANGTPGLSWLQMVPDDVLRILESAMDVEYSLDFESVKGLDVRYNIKSEIDRRERLDASNP